MAWRAASCWGLSCCSACCCSAAIWERRAFSSCCMWCSRTCSRNSICAGRWLKLERESKVQREISQELERTIRTAPAYPGGSAQSGPAALGRGCGRRARAPAGAACCACAPASPSAAFAAPTGPPPVTSPALCHPVSRQPGQEPNCQGASCNRHPQSPRKGQCLRKCPRTPASTP